MANLGLGDVAAFPFLDPSSPRAVRDGVALLRSWARLDPAVEPGGRGRLPAPGATWCACRSTPASAAWSLEAHREGNVREVLVIAAALSIQDVRERPLDDSSKPTRPIVASSYVARTCSGPSRCWDHLDERRRALSSNEFRREAQGRVPQPPPCPGAARPRPPAERAARSVGVVAGDEEATPDVVHRAVLAGLLSQIGHATARRANCRGTGHAFTIAAARRSPANRPSGSWRPSWSRRSASGRGAWRRSDANGSRTSLRRCSIHLHGRPLGRTRRACRSCTEKATLYGLPVVAARTIGLARVDPDAGPGAVRRRRPGPTRVGDSSRVHRPRTRRSSTTPGPSATRGAPTCSTTTPPSGVLRGGISEERGVGPPLRPMVEGRSPRRPRPPDPRVGRPRRRRRPTFEGADFPDEWRTGAPVLPIPTGSTPTTSNDGVTVHVPLALLDQVEPWAFTGRYPATGATWWWHCSTRCRRTLAGRSRRSRAPSTLLAGLRSEERPLVDVLADALDGAGRPADPRRRARSAPGAASPADDVSWPVPTARRSPSARTSRPSAAWSSPGFVAPSPPSSPTCRGGPRRPSPPGACLAPRRQRGRRRPGAAHRDGCGGHRLSRREVADRVTATGLRDLVLFLGARRHPGSGALGPRRRPHRAPQRAESHVGSLLVRDSMEAAAGR